jgi:hypothetical protein
LRCVSGMTRDGVQAIAEGAIVHAFAGEEHWHGALPDSFMSHQSIVLGGSTEWLEGVSEQEYLAAVATLRADRRVRWQPLAHRGHRALAVLCGRRCHLIAAWLYAERLFY